MPLVDESLEALQARLAMLKTVARPEAPVCLVATGCDLAGVRLEPVSTAPVDEEALESRLAEKLRAVAARREKGRDGRVALGDEVVLDVLGYANGRLIPFSARSGWSTEVVADPTLPGFFEALVGVSVGEGVMVEVTLPEDHEVAALRGASARFLVEVKRAFEVEPLEGSPELWAARLGATDLEALLERFADELEVEAEEDADAELTERVLDAVAERAEVSLPEGLVDREVELAWRRHERPLLVARDFSNRELEEALHGWLVDPPTRLAAERRLRVAAGLEHVVASRGLKVEPSLRLELEAGLSETAGVSLEAFSAVVGERPHLPGELDALALRLLAIETVRHELTSPRG